MSPQISVIAPIYNEVDSLPHLLPAIATSLERTGLTYEVICVDDGSKDGSTQWLQEQASFQGELVAVILRKNYGQTAAMAAGFDQARGEIIVTLDADLQNDPADIPALLTMFDD